MDRSVQGLAGEGVRSVAEWLGQGAPPEDSRGVRLAPESPLAHFLAAAPWCGHPSAQGWWLAPASGAVRRCVAPNGWSVQAKFYWLKVGDDALVAAERERAYTACAAPLLGAGPYAAVEVYGQWAGVLFLAHVPGPTLLEVIQGQPRAPSAAAPGFLPLPIADGIEAVTRLLARLHGEERGLPAEVSTYDDASYFANYGKKVVANLAKHGVLAPAPALAQSLSRAIDGWQEGALLADFPRVFAHGDATVSNFILPGDGAVVAIDWERARASDPAADLGRLCAEVRHSCDEHLQGAAGVVAAEVVRQVYAATWCGRGDAVSRLLERARYHEGVSLLRIARNGWLSRELRQARCEQALGLLRLRSA